MVVDPSCGNRELPRDDYVEWYSHHGRRVAVLSELKGRHREHCLCYRCTRFTPERRETNCHLASFLYDFCCSHNTVTPVWECPEFEEAP